MPVAVPKGVDVAIDNGEVKVTGGKQTLSLRVHPQVGVTREENELRVAALDGSRNAIALAGTMRALISNMVTGVSAGFERRLELQGVGYRAQAKGKTLTLSLGYSHPIDYPVPEGVTIETPSNTEIVIKGADKQVIGQIAAEIRAFRSPDPYKGKGVRYAGEQIVLKEAKKK